GIHGVPGRGARVTATLAVAGVDSLFVNVDRGGGTYLTIPVPAFRWGVGGGASDVRLCSSTDPDCPALGSPDDPRLVVAGGGGATGTGGAAGDGGDAGCELGPGETCAPGTDGADAIGAFKRGKGAKGGGCAAGGVGGAGDASGS